MDTIGVIKISAKPFYTMPIGQDTIGISKTGKSYYSSLNSRNLFVSKSDKDLLERTVPVLSLVAGMLCKRNGLKPSSVRKASSLDPLIKNIDRNLKPVSVLVLDAKPDETQENTPVDASLPGKLKAYVHFVKNVAANIDQLNHLSQILLRTDIKKSMWGSKDVLVVLHNVRTAVNRVGEFSEEYDKSVERSDTIARFMYGCLCNTGLESQSRLAAGKIIDNFSILKTYASELAQSMCKLNTVDRTIEASTGYPATFVMSSLLMDFQYEYESLVNNMIKVASIETNIIEPLLAFKIRTTGASSNVC